VLRTAGLIKANVPRAPDAENLEIDSARRTDSFFVRTTVGINLGLRYAARREVRALWRKIQMVEQVRPHKMPVALRVFRRQRIVLVEIEGDDIGKTESFLAMQPDQLCVKSNGRRTRGQTEHDFPLLVLAPADESSHLRGHGAGGDSAAGKNSQRDVFITAADQGSQGVHGFQKITTPY
jgi:hypothetical protein